MGSESEDQGLGARLTEAIRSLISSNDEKPAEQAALQMQRSIESWQRAAGLGRLFATAGRDLVTTVGEQVELSFSVGTLGRLRAKSARFFVGSEAVATLEVGEEEMLHAPFSPTHAGLFKIELELRSASDEVVLSRSVSDVGYLQVFDSNSGPVQGVVAVDAALLFGEADPSWLNDFHGVYFDLAERTRVDKIRQRVLQAGLWEGAIFDHSAETAQTQFKTLGVDFRTVLLRASLRRARAAGVPLVGICSEDERVLDIAALEGLVQIAPGGSVGSIGSIGSVGSVGLLQTAATEFLAKARDPGRRLWLMTGAECIPGNRVHVELDNARAREAVFSAIESAVRTVHMQLYILKDGRFAEHLTVRLINRARAGVRVRVMVDALYSAQNVLGMSNPIVKLLEQEPGIEIFATHPIGSSEVFDPLYMKQRDHRKLLIVDGRIAFVSGRNGGDEYYVGFEETAITDRTPHERIPWLDAHIEVEGPMVDRIDLCFLRTWAREKGIAPPPQAQTETRALEGGVNARFVVHEGVEDTNAMNAYEALFDGARSHIFILNDFPVAQTLAASVRRAIARGVRVVFITGTAVARRADGSFFDGPASRELFEYMTKRRLAGLMKTGVEVYEYTTKQLPTIVSVGGVVRPYVHAKLVTADGLAASVGSANLDVTASYWEREANVIVEDAQVVGALEEELEQIRRGSFRIMLDSAYWRAEEEQRRLAASLWPESLYQ